MWSFGQLVRRARRWGEPLKIIVTDYVEVSKDVGAELKRSPVKSLLWLLLGGAITACHVKCPSLSCYKSEVINYCNELGMCAERTRSQHAKHYVDQVSTLLTDGHIKYVNFGVCAIVMQAPNSSRCFNYHETCTHLQPRIWTFSDRVIDIGVWNNWLALRKAMVDFDVNENEFSSNHDNLV